MLPASARKKSEIVSHTCYWKKRYLKISRNVSIHSDSAYKYMSKIISLSTYFIDIDNFWYNNRYTKEKFLLRTKILDLMLSVFKLKINKYASLRRFWNNFSQRDFNSYLIRTKSNVKIDISFGQHVLVNFRITKEDRTPTGCHDDESMATKERQLHAPSLSVNCQLIFPDLHHAKIKNLSFWPSSYMTLR